MKVSELFHGVWTSKTKLVPHNMYSYKDTAKVIASTKVTPKSITIKNGNTGEIIGIRTIYSK